MFLSTMQSNSKRCSSEEEVQEELGIKALHTPIGLNLLLSSYVH